MHYLLALSPPAGCGQGLDPVPEWNDWEQEEWGVRRANQTSKCPIKYCSLPRIWKSSGAKGREEMGGERERERKNILGESKATEKIAVLRGIWFGSINTCTSLKAAGTYSMALHGATSQIIRGREGGKKTNHSLTTFLLWISCSAFIITCVCSRGSNRTEPVDWDKQPFYNEGWSCSAIQRRSSC